MDKTLQFGRLSGAASGLVAIAGCRGIVDLDGILFYAKLIIYLYVTCVYLQMRAIFVELPAFSRYRANYLDDHAFRELQNLLLQHPEAGDVIQGTGGLRKIRFADKWLIFL